MAACIAFAGLALIACVAAGLTLLKMEPAVKNRSEKPVIGLEFMSILIRQLKEPYILYMEKLSIAFMGSGYSSNWWGDRSGGSNAP